MRGNLRNQNMACMLLDVNKETFAEDSLKVMPEEVLMKVRPKLPQHSL